MCFSGDHAQSFQRPGSQLNPAAPAVKKHVLAWEKKKKTNLLGFATLEYILGAICFNLSKGVKSQGNKPAGGTAWIKTETWCTGDELEEEGTMSDTRNKS